MTHNEADASSDHEIERVPSLIWGLDTILNSGFLRGGLYMIQGGPGTGKTVLGSQVIFGHAAQGSRALFVTVLGENHGRMMAHLRPMKFFNQSLIPDYVTYISAYQPLEDEGLDGLVTLLRREVQAHGATLLLLDGMSAVQAKTAGVFEMKRFTHELQTLASVTNCTMFLLTTALGSSSPEHTMVDGVIELQQRLYGVRSERRLIVHKLRGTGYLEGEHAFRITREGLTIFPRIEAQFALPTRRETPPSTRISSGIASFDAMVQGGLPGATMAALTGPSGAGKTTLGLHFLGRSSSAEPGLLFGCYETPERLRLKAEMMGLDLAAAERRGDVELLWFPVGEHILDELAHRLLDAVRRRGVKRLFIDGISGFQQAALESERSVRFWSALSRELRALGVTTMHTMEVPELLGPEIRLPGDGISAIAETVVLLRYVELRSQLFRLISLFKVREGAFDPTIRQFVITDSGIVVGEPFEGVEAILSGMPREAARNAALISLEDSSSPTSTEDIGRPE
jgi:circadian clock protein KaiC